LRIFAGFAPHLSQAGVSFSAMLAALEFYLGPPKEVAVLGASESAATQALLKALRQRYLPDAVVVCCDPAEAEVLGGRIPLLASRQAIQGLPTAYVCTNMACRLPVHTAEELVAQLTAKQG
jgi:uncharacterized protein